MKRVILTAVLSICSLNASANDGGIAYLQVSKMFAKPNKMTIIGQSVSKFMDLMPGANYVADMNYGDYTKGMVFSDGKNYMTINCSKGELVTPSDEGHPAEVKPTTPSCSFEYTANSEPIQIEDVAGDGWELDPIAVAKKLLGVRN